MPNLPFGFDKPEDSPGFLLWQTTMVWQRQIRKALEQHNLSHAQFVIMATLMWFHAHKYDTTQTLISHQTKLDKMTVSKSLKKLALLGYINRTEHDKDNRAKSISLTEKGRKIVHVLVPIVETVDAQFFGKLETLEQRQLKIILGKIVEENDA